MPLNTATPMACRISAPAPVERTSGRTPRMKAIEVIRIGRSRSRLASIAAATGVRPANSSSRANSTIRMAFLAERPTSTIRPIWVKTLLSPWVSQTPEHGGEQPHRHDHDDGQRQGQALVLGGQHQEHEQQREREHQHAGVAGDDLLVGQLSPLVAEALRQRWPWRCGRTASWACPGGVARRGAAVDVGADRSRCSAWRARGRRCS